MLFNIRRLEINGTYGSMIIEHCQTPVSVSLEPTGILKTMIVVAETGIIKPETIEISFRSADLVEADPDSGWPTE